MCQIFPSLALCTFFWIDPVYLTLVSDAGNCKKEDCVISMTIVKLETIANSNYSIKQHTNRDKDLFYKITKLSPAKLNPLIFVTVINKQFARINSCKTQPKWDSQEWKK